MKKLTFLLFLAFGFSFANTTNPISQDVQVGDELVINVQKADKFNHVDFPRLNFIVKRGGIGNYSSVDGEVVVVKNVTTNNQGNTQVTLERKNGKKFFGYLNAVDADLTKALNSGEISKK
ncbi:hypothetical protein JJL45_11415 [Tamlana sp. s12]|uniref:Dihydroorotase n=1 Tax=Pseudotamlana haliotis TaxID=2614804 RepID=A0A6N6MKX4_9FLAO|nr:MULTISPECIES: hypothetical protein [Tamlana]KAB1070346.1 hypothetical protein F6U93_01985 [Tamlana haliotis]OBQ51783.1 hypothetical protein VQ01_15005 [Tamlana sp. s12]QQY81533.1 hypothetical protein JJL45_11415 [Tamlana sp. s12]